MYEIQNFEQNKRYDSLPGADGDSSKCQRGVSVLLPSARIAAKREKTAQILVDDKISDKIAAGLVASGTINAEDREIYKFGLKYIANIFLNAATTLIIGFIFGMVWQSVLFMVSYIPLRSYAGGYHARTPLRCYIFSVIFTACVLLGIKYIPYDSILLLTMTFVSGAMIFVFAPVGDENKPLDATETMVFKKRARIVLSAEIGLICLFLFLNLAFIAVCLVVSVSFAGLMVVLGKQKNKNRKKNLSQ